MRCRPVSWWLRCTSTASCSSEKGCCELGERLAQLHLPERDVPQLQVLAPRARVELVRDDERSHIERRANSVRDELIQEYQVESGVIDTQGYGERRPVAPNDTAEGREQNRRADIVVESEEKEAQFKE